ncbi:MAG: class I SAM-dependent methyltransferase, partial [Bradyrhizobium sp.]
MFRARCGLGLSPCLLNPDNSRDFAMESCLSLCLPVVAEKSHNASTATPEDIFAPEFVAKLFDEMSATYGLVNYVTSFGFCERWRRVCVEQLALQDGETVYDLMSGGGELWSYILPQIGKAGRLTAVDFSTAMCQLAAGAATKWPEHAIDIHQDDVLSSRLPENSADAIVAAFGLKTFSDEQQRSFAEELARTLKPGGRCSLMEVSVPESSLLQMGYMLYLKYAIPVLGWMFLGNPDNYRMLGI